MSIVFKLFNVKNTEIREDFIGFVKCDTLKKIFKTYGFSEKDFELIMFTINSEQINTKDKNKKFQIRKNEMLNVIVSSTDEDMRKNLLEIFKNKNKDNRGNWEFSFFQKKIIPNEEQQIKESLRPENSFNPKNIPDYINPSVSKEEEIYNKHIEIKKEESNNKKSKKKLTASEQIILDKYIIDKNKAVLKDYDDIKHYGLNAQPKTDEGRTKLLLLSLNDQVAKNNTDIICNIYLRLQEESFKITPDLEKEFHRSLNEMNLIVKNSDLIEMQFTKFHDQMPPLNVKGFKKFDKWQIGVIENIDAGVSTIVSAPTSAGKSVLSGYAATKGKTLIVVPTDALAWQMASYIGGVINDDVPIMTQTYLSNPKRDEMCKLCNMSNALVGTAETIVDFLPFINNDYKWVIFDEIHMIGKQEGKAMETIAKMFNNIPFLALSATIGNLDFLTEWFSSLNRTRKVEKIVCDERFFNLQRYYYNPEKNEFIVLHPLSLVDKNEFKDGTVSKKNLQATPPDAWSIYTEIKKVYGDIGNLDHKKYFGINERIELSKATKWFYDLIKFMVDNYDDDKVSSIITHYKNIDISNETVDLVKMAFLLKSEKKNPTIIFQKNTIACLRMVRQFAKIIEELEYKSDPRLRSRRAKAIKKAERQNKRDEKTKDKTPSGNEDSRKELKKFLEEKEKEEKILEDIQEPKKDFILNEDQYFSIDMIKGWVKKLGKYFPNSSNDEYHFIIKLLWRGVGVYAKGLPDSYLQLVQNLSCKKRLAIVFSDMSLAFGVSMPFRTVVICKDNIVEDDLDSMLYHQMAGRAGRRGLDKKGNIIFAGYKWKRIEELSISSIPDISGTKNINYVIPQANKISSKTGNNMNWDNMLMNCLNGESDEDNMETLNDIKSNYEEGWNFAMKDDINHLHMMWILRESDEAINTSFILPYLKKGFEMLNPEIEGNQIQIAHFLSFFINKRPSINSETKLPMCSIFEQESFSDIFDNLNDLQLDASQDIDARVFISIKDNKLLDCDTEKEADDLRQELLKFGNKVKAIQHFVFHTEKEIEQILRSDNKDYKASTLPSLLGKLLTRIWWVYHLSSPLMKKLDVYEDYNYSDDELSG